MSAENPFRRLALDLGSLASPQTVHNVEKAVEQSARRVKDSWNGKLYTDGHAKHTGRSITYDVGTAHTFDLFAGDLDGISSSAIVAQIGAKANRGKQAGIVRLLENGSVNNAPHGYGAAALHEEEPNLEAAIAFASWAAERDAGLG